MSDERTDREDANEGDAAPERPESTPEAGSPPSPPPQRRSTWKLLLLGLVILLAGMTIGAAGTLFVVRRAVLHAAQHPGELPERALDRLDRRLDLTDAQRAEIERILRQRMRRLAALRERLRPHVDRELDALDEEISDVLTPQQRERWQRDYRRLRRYIQPPMPDTDRAPPQSP